MRQLMTAGVVAALAAGSAPAQWTSDHAANTTIADRSGEQVQPKVRAAPDGGCVIVWFDNSAGGYDVYAQRLDAQGNALWPSNGVLVRDRSVSSTQDFDAQVDASGNVIIAFNDDVNGNSPISVHKLSPGGAALWAIQASGAQAGFKGPPQLALLDDGGIAVAWSAASPLSVHVHKLDADGESIWPGPVVLSEAGQPYNLCDIQPAPGGAMIVSWVRCAGSNCVTSNKHLYAQKLDATGMAQWDRVPATPAIMDPVIVFDGTSLQNGYFPPFVPDGAGGAVFAWYETGGNRDAFVQRITSGGAELFAHNGVSVSIQAARFQLGAALAFDAASGDAYVAWIESNTAQSQWAMYAQRVTDEGVRAWGDNGIELLPISTTQGSFTAALARAGGGVEVYSLANCCGAAGAVHAFALGADGAAAWASPPVIVSSAPSAKTRLDAARLSSGAAAVAWTDARLDTGNIYAQRVNPDGSLGNPAACPADFDGNGEREVGDIFAFLSAWFAGAPAAFEFGGTPGVPAIFAFLAAWFADCP
ncbi:MAG: hypothetical protein KF869_08095 [Phycisphaeraceae bacterium]|nr:hypothetical protein [Phycisphaeraceae bacterium]